MTWSLGAYTVCKYLKQQHNIIFVLQLLMSVFDNSMKRCNVVENDPYDWERTDSEDMLNVGTLATTAQQLTRLTPAYMG